MVRTESVSFFVGKEQVMKLFCNLHLRKIKTVTIPQKIASNYSNRLLDVGKLN